MTDNSEALLPCPNPWCADDCPKLSQRGGHLYFVICTGCGVKCNYEHSEAEAIAAWNTRPSSPAATIEICPACNGCGFQNPQASTEACGVCNGSGGVSPASDGDAVERNATEAEAEAAIVKLERAIYAARNSNQAGENAVVRAAAALDASSAPELTLMREALGQIKALGDRSPLDGNVTYEDAETAIGIAAGALAALSTQPVSDGGAVLLDRVFIGDGEYVRYDVAVAAVMSLQRELAEARAASPVSDGSEQ